MPPKYCIDIFGNVPKKFRNRRYEHSLTVPIDKSYRQLVHIFESAGTPAHWLKKHKRKRQWGARINQKGNSHVQ